MRGTGKTCRVRVGDAEYLPLEDARDQAEILIGKMRQGLIQSPSSVKPKPVSVPRLSGGGPQNHIAPRINPGLVSSKRIGYG